MDMMRMRIIDISYLVDGSDTKGKLYSPKRVKLFDGTFAHDVCLSTHCGTHMEFSDHYFDDGITSADYLPSRFISRCHLLDCIPGAVLAESAEDRLGGVIKAGDSLILRNTDHKAKAYVTQGLADWIVERGLTILGIDYHSTLGKDISESRLVHDRIIGHGGLLLEGLDHLEDLPSSSFLLIALPWKATLDSTWTRAIAILEDA